MDEVRVMEQSWDYLIVLDACRYDYFEQLFGNYLEGELSKKTTVGTATVEWRDKSFPDYYDDVMYISANPYINSMAPVRGFNAKEHFAQIYDLWLDEWSKEKGTVMPQAVTKRALEIINANMDKRAIIHYIQPHEPYIGSSVECPGFEQPAAGEYLQGVSGKTLKSAFLRKLMKLVSGILYWTGIRGYYILWTVRESLGMPPANPMDTVRRKYGKEVLRKAYEENVGIVLGEVAKLVEKLKGKIVVTADHGEMLGEDNRFCHWSRATEKHLREVPWLIIDKGKKTRNAETHSTAGKITHKSTTTGSNDQNKQQIQEKLKLLGYID